MRRPVIRGAVFLVGKPEAPSECRGAHDHGPKSTSEVKTAGPGPSFLQPASAPAPHVAKVASV